MIFWPIDEAAGRKPANWPGWPQGKKFALVLTHDVEDLIGLGKCRQLAELEMAAGFRSSFNFIPEGPYVVPPELRAWLTGHDFEIGVHDLHHDGKLFTSRLSFARKARKINRYLAEWNASGFRGGFMLRELDWIKDLAIQYDASTFDSDPFEPQSGGTRTIFPFWYPNSEGGGHIELPYTLPQDSTMFLLLREETPEIWLRKIDWIARHGGMALVIVHPDYTRFENEKASKRTFPSAMYSSLLKHVAEKYPGQYWNALPKEVASWYAGTRRQNSPLASSPENSSATKVAALRGKRAAVLLYSEYPGDPRPRRAAEAMVESGMEVDLFCLSEEPGELEHELVNGVRVFRLPLQRKRGNRRAYLKLYGRFLFSAFWFLTRQSLKRKYDLVHVHNMPDVLVFSALVPKLMGSKILLDLHDPMPELMMTIYGAGEDSTMVKTLKRFEKLSTGFANAVLTVNIACKRIFSQRSCEPEKISVIMNSPDEGIFAYRDQTGAAPVPKTPGAPFKIMYHGSIVQRHGLDLAVTALGEIRSSIPNAELWIYGQNTEFLKQVMASVQGSPLHDAVHYCGPKNLNEIVEAIRDCDVGIIPNRRSIFTELNTPTRIFEYLSQGKPVIAPRASGILDYFGPEDLIYFELGDAQDLARKLKWAHENPAAVAATVERGQHVYRNHCWSSERERLVNLVADTLYAPREMGAETIRDLQ
ncbi:MAG: GDP-mannose-dependent alpha-(1-6)-phosphatidylinositol monomannoside mannosyltransferase [Verrucomicrobia bacterium]|nr:GDP-mannose-dependent alpha-(1-6)-phosphatidylinositol monomannoside mannosyltransferase [Verrucomicrobiota bacterium]